MKRQPVIILLILFFAIPVSASTQADGALDFVRTSVEKILTILRDPASKEESTREVQRQKLRTLAETLFDYDEISRRALGRKRKAFTPEQMDEFSDLFTRLLKKTYLNKIQEYSDEKVIYNFHNILTPTILKAPAKELTKRLIHKNDYKLNNMMLADRNAAFHPVSLLIYVSSSKISIFAFPFNSVI